MCVARSQVVLNHWTSQVASVEKGLNRVTNMSGCFCRLEQVRRQSHIADSLNTDMTDILREKDETIAQLEEKLIENDQKMEELRDELRQVN